MPTMSSRKKKLGKQPMQVRVPKSARLEFKRFVIGELDGRVLGDGDEATMETVAGLLFLWFKEQDPRAMERMLAPYVPTLRELEKRDAEEGETGASHGANVYPPRTGRNKRQA